MLTPRNDPMFRHRRIFFLLLIILIAVITTITWLTRVGRASEDPFLDPMANPNIRVAAAAGKIPEE